MTEDEAFIRAVVDNPGDDTPRLVYADWLDDRDDPRGPYLRAEHAWAATHDPGDRDELTRLAKALDPVWVARVSRPPAGVCTECARFRGETSPTTDEAIDRIASQFGVTFPPEYRAFLLNYNGGVLYSDPPEPQPEPDVEVDCGFHSVEHLPAAVETIFARGHESNRHCGLFPIGALDIGRACYLLGVGSMNAPRRLYGRVFTCYGDSLPWVRNGDFVEVENWDHVAAASLPHLLAGFVGREF